MRYKKRSVLNNMKQSEDTGSAPSYAWRVYARLTYPSHTYWPPPSQPDAEMDRQSVTAI